MKIKNIKSFQSFGVDIPTERGLYAITGENGSGKSTVSPGQGTERFLKDEGFS